MANLSDKIGPSGVLTGVTGESIKNLSDVYGSMSPADGQALIYDTTNGWQAETLESGGAAPVDTQTFTTSGTWTKPSSGSFAIIEVWGGGGSGSKTADSSGGGGGGYNVLQIDLSSLGATETVTIGAGGASQTTANTSGNNGGNTTFGSHLTGYGGGGGQYYSDLGGGGGGMRGASTGRNGGAGYSEPITTTTSNTFGNSHVHITAGATGIYFTSGNTPGRFSYYGGGSGGTGTGASTGAAGGGSYYGGGGGGSDGTTPGSGGISRFGGNGGDGDGSAGSQPGGGGGGSAGDSGAGGDGMCVVKVYA